MAVGTSSFVVLEVFYNSFKIFIYIYIYIATLMIVRLLNLRKLGIICYLLIDIYNIKSSQVKSSFIVNFSTCTVHTYRELKLCYSQTLGAYS